MTHSASVNQPSAAAAKPSKAQFVGFTAVAALIAAVAAGSSFAFGLPVWAMFVGWVAFFTRGLSARDGATNLGCVWLGMSFGIAATLALGAWGSTLGLFTLPVVVFVVAMIVVSLRGVPVMNNVLGYFLGLITWFAAHLEPSLENLAHLGTASALGSIAGWTSHRLQHHGLRPMRVHRE